MDKIGKNLEVYRLKNGLSPKQAAMLLNISEREYLAFENGRSDISAVQLLRLCEYYGVDIDGFIAGEEMAGKKNGPEGTAKPGSVRPAGIKKATRSARQGQKTKARSFLKEDGKEETAGYGEERLLNLVARIVADAVLREVEDEEKLKQFPDGFHYGEEKACVICSRVVSGEQSWFDRHGLKCITCQRALESRIVPYEATQSKDSFYTAVQLELNFGLKGKTLRRWKRNGTIRSRLIPELDGKGTYFELFLLSDNEQFLPPHEMLRIGGPIRETDANGAEEFVFYPWYCFVDPIEHLKDYGISRYLRFEPSVGKEGGQPTDTSDNPDG